MFGLQSWKGKKKTRRVSVFFFLWFVFFLEREREREREREKDNHVSVCDTLCFDDYLVIKIICVKGEIEGLIATSE